MEILKKMKCCKTCGHVTYYPKSKKYECGKYTTDALGVCDRWQEDISLTQVMKKIDKKIVELDKYGDGEYQLTPRPPFRQNYHVQEAKELSTK